MARPEDCKTWNALRPAALAYPTEILDSLLTRLEEPDARNRWDNPLLNVLADDPIGPIADQVAKHLLTPTYNPVPYQSTVVRPVAGTNYLHERDGAIRAIADGVLQAVREGWAATAGAAGISVPGTNAKVVLPSRGIVEYIWM